MFRSIFAWLSPGRAKALVPAFSATWGETGYRAVAMHIAAATPGLVARRIAP